MGKTWGFLLTDSVPFLNGVYRAELMVVFLIDLLLLLFGIKKKKERRNAGLLNGSDTDTARYGQQVSKFYPLSFNKNVESIFIRMNGQ